MRTVRIVVAATALWASCAVAQGFDPAPGRGVAASCSACHGTNGVSATQQVPSLAGASRADIVQKMQDFKSGKRAGTIMPQLAKGYTDGEIELAASWFASQAK